MPSDPPSPSSSSPQPDVAESTINVTAVPTLATAAEAPRTDASNAAPALSKNAQKKARKAELMKERKLERRVREREARKEKKRARAAAAADGENSAGEEDEDGERAKKRARVAAGPKTPFDARVLIDLGFDEMMSDKEVASLISQLAYSYSANRRSQTPFTSILFTSLGGRTKERMDGMNDSGYMRWAATEWWPEEFNALWSDGGSTVEADAGTSAEGEGQSEAAPQPQSEPSLDSTHADADINVDIENGSAPADKKTKTERAKAHAAQSSVVYLTADSADVLEELKEGETYIIGGICDHNRYKNLCLDKAQKHGVRAAQLPIGRYLQNLPTRKVLTVNQVFEILVKWVETRSWEEALYSVIPRRKFQAGGKGASKGGETKEGGDEGEEGAADAIVVALEDVEVDMLR